MNGFGGLAFVGIMSGTAYGCMRSGMFGNAKSFETNNQLKLTEGFIGMNVNSKMVKKRFVSDLTNQKIK